MAGYIKSCLRWKMKTLVFLWAFLSLFSLSALDLSLYKTIVCFGDSITHGGTYHMFLQEYLAETDPSHPRRVINRGISGSTVPALLKRVDKMLQTDKPDLVIIQIGINDLISSTRFAEKDLPFEKAVKKYPVFKRFEKNLGDLIDILNKAKVKVVLLGTPPYNESANPEVTASLNPNMDTSGVRNFQIIEKRLAKQKGAEFIDIYTPLLKNLQENDAACPRGKRDRVHPSRQEHLIIARTVIGSSYTPGPKQKIAMQYTQVQAEIQRVAGIYGRIPDSCKTADEQIEFYKNWVGSLKGRNFEYWNKMLPDIISILKDPETKLKTLYKKRDAAFDKLYQK